MGNAALKIIETPETMALAEFDVVLIPSNRGSRSDSLLGSRCLWLPKGWYKILTFIEGKWYLNRVVAKSTTWVDSQKNRSAKATVYHAAFPFCIAHTIGPCTGLLGVAVSCGTVCQPYMALFVFDRADRAKNPSFTGVHHV